MQIDIKQTIGDTSDTQQNTTVRLITELIRFNILLGFGVPSFICYVFILIYIFTHKTLRSAPNNYCLLIILILQFFCNIFDIPSQMYFYWQGRVLIESGVYCYMWQFIDYCTWTVNLILLAWASFERHFLIFHERFLRSKWANICLHYAPPFIIITYGICYYIYGFAFYKCKNPYLFQQNFCNGPCYSNNQSMMLWNRVVNYILPSICTAIFSVALLLRVIYSKRHLQRAFSWRKHSKMAYQIISISFLSIATILPYSISGFLNNIRPNTVPKQIGNLFAFIAVVEPLCVPFVYLTSISEIWTSIKTKIRRATTRQTAPIVFLKK